MSIPPSAVPDPRRANSDHAMTAPAALKLAREAMTRWRGGHAVAASPPHGLTRVSLQANHLEQAQRNLCAWRALGGFAQDPGLPAPKRQVDTCID
jgi:hypothetical protein